MSVINFWGSLDWYRPMAVLNMVLKCKAFFLNLFFQNNTDSVVKLEPSHIYLSLFA